MKTPSMLVKMDTTQKRRCGQVHFWVRSVVGSANFEAKHVLSNRSMNGTLLLAVIVALVALVPEAAAVYRFSPSSSSSSLTSADAKGQLMANSALDGNQAKLDYNRVLSAAQSKSKLPSAGQKEAEQPMNPNEVFPDNSASLDSLVDFDQELTLDADELEKRAKWNSLQGGWGKRAANNWNKLSAAWGKRRVPNGVNGWNNLSGMWGKKRAKWNELSGMWGKRAWNDMSGGWGKKKRSGSSPHWNKLRGMWGKRSAVAPLASSQ